VAPEPSWPAEAATRPALGAVATPPGGELDDLLIALAGYGELLLETLAPGHPARRHAERIRLAADRAAALSRRPATAGLPGVLLVDDDELVRDLAAELLERAGFDVERASGSTEALEACARRRGDFDVLVVDLTLPAASAPALAARLRRLYPQAGVVYLAGRGGVRPDADGTVLEKPFSARDLVRAVQEASGRASRRPAPSSPLTPREAEIVELLADGLTNEKAAAALGISAETVQSHVRNAMAKVEASTRTALVATAMRAGLIS